MHMKRTCPSSGKHASSDGSTCQRSSSGKHASSDGSTCQRSSSGKHASSDGSTCQRSSSGKHASSDGSTCQRSSSGKHASSDGSTCQRPSSGKHASSDGSTLTRLPTSRQKLARSNIIIIMFLIAAWMLPEVSAAAANQNETKSTSPSWNSTGSDSMRNQTSNVPRNPSQSWSPLSRRGDNPSHSWNNSSLSILVPPTQQSVLEPGFRNASNEKSGKSAVAAGMRSREKDDVSKIVSIVVPFTCVIFVAGTLCVTYKLCHRYRCYNNQPGLTKCLTFCDRCMSTPYVFQLSDGKKDSNCTPSVSSDSGRLFRYSVNSVSSSSSRMSTTSSPAANNTQRHFRQTTAPQYSPVRHSSSSSSHSGVSRSLRHSSSSSSHSDASPQSPRSFKPSLGVITSGRQTSDLTVASGRQTSDLTAASNPASARSTIVYPNPRHAQTKQPSTGHSQRPSFHLSRQSHMPGYARASGHTRGSIQSPPQPHKVPGAIVHRQDSAR